MWVGQEPVRCLMTGNSIFHFLFRHTWNSSQGYYIIECRVSVDYLSMQFVERAKELESVV